jgi:glycosyltransferase involved in cell wall biosynthesis
MYLGKKVSVIIPAKNEAANVSRLIPKIPKFVDETIIVVSSETDSTLESIRKFDKSRKIISLIQDNMGKGDAQKKGLSQITGDYVCMIDADGSVNLAEIQQMLNLLINNNLDLVGEALMI